MKNNAQVAVIIPALNEELSIGRVVSALPKWVDDVLVVDNGSSDRTAAVAREAGARVVMEPRRGYGAACLAGIAAVNNADIIVFLDGDFSDHPEEIDRLVDPVANDEADFVIGSRVLGRCETGALTLQARLGNLLACFLIRVFWRVKFTDLGPFRAIRASSLRDLRMCDRSYGWTVEMQIRAVRMGLRIREVPVSYRKRIGKSKISGTAKGVFAAGTKILAVILLFCLDSLISRTARRNKRNRLIIFTRYPEPGKAKTRLIPALGPDGAAELHRKMTEQVVRTARLLRWRYPVSVEIHFEGGSTDLMRSWLGPTFRYKRQAHGDLGYRMLYAFKHSFAEGARSVVMIGADCPGLSPEIIESAFRNLRRKDLVLGPARDGGYYLVGLRHVVPELFRDIPWSTDKVFPKTTDAAKNLGLSIFVLETLDDVDRPEDLPTSEKRFEVCEISKKRISIIIPTLNEASHLTVLLAELNQQPGVEVIVADGGSSDNTVEVAAAFGARVVFSAPGRARQMNAGARVATGEALVFLHADTHLPEKFEEYIWWSLADEKVAGGAFKFQLDAESWSLRLIERGANYRSRSLQMPYGDQAIFLRTETFRKLGGYSEIPIMEDVELVRRLRRLGRIVTVPVPAVTSARRFSTLSAWRAVLVNQICLAAYWLGIHPELIGRWYYGDKTAEG